MNRDKEDWVGEGGAGGENEAAWRAETQEQFNLNSVSHIVSQVVINPSSPPTRSAFNATITAITGFRPQPTTEAMAAAAANLHQPPPQSVSPPAVAIVPNSVSSSSPSSSSSSSSSPAGTKAAAASRGGGGGGGGTGAAAHASYLKGYPYLFVRETDQVTPMIFQEKKEHFAT